MELYRWAPAGVFANLSMARLALRTLCNVMLDWLINRERAVDLFFVKLHALPHRINWRDAINPQTTKFPLYKRRAMMADGHRKLFEWLVTGKALAVYQDGTIARLIEAEMTSQWWKLTKEVERNRKAMLKDAYAQKVMESIRASFETSARLWKAWDNASCLSRGIFHKSGSGRELAPSTSRGVWLRFQTARRLEYHLIRNMVRRSGQPRYKTNGDGKIERLLPVQPVQREKAYMRNPRRLAANAKRRESDLRLLVLDDFESVEQEVKMLARRGRPKK